MDYIKKLTAELVEKILAKGVRDMPQNPAAQGYDERQIRGFYYIPEKEILGVIMEIEATLSQVFTDIKNNKVNVSDVIDNLYSSERTKPLSANMGRDLNSQIATERSLRMSADELRVKYSDVINNLLSEETTKPLSAKQGAVLDEKISDVKETINKRTAIYLSADENGYVYVNKVGGNE